ncbi:MAG: HAD-IIB family hydrolase [Thiomicrorhabdus sp.]|nr:HAD-IIB family hydrolase [Thiomicrorhabdus sp.]
MRKLLFTDLDGSLLDHHNYDYSPALPAIKVLQTQHVPWILTTSKTAEEVVDIRHQLDNPYPFIVENGAGIFWPKGSMTFSEIFRKEWLQSIEILQWQEDYQYISLNPVLLSDILALTERFRKQFHFIFTGFSEMTVQQVADCTGLDLVQAAKAKQRHFSEPLLWQDSDERLQQFKRLMQPYGLQLIKGGRFVHLMGLSNKGLALRFLADYYHQAWQEPVETMALGDGSNDIPLLEASDYPVVIRSPVNPPPEVNHSHVMVTREYGPEGWNQAVLNWLQTA